MACVPPWFGGSKLSRQSHCIYTAFGGFLQSGRVPSIPECSSLEMRANGSNRKERQLRFDLMNVGRVLISFRPAICWVAFVLSKLLPSSLEADLWPSKQLAVRGRGRKGSSYLSREGWVSCGSHLICLRLFCHFDCLLWLTTNGYFGLLLVHRGPVTLQLQGNHPMILRKSTNNNKGKTNTKVANKNICCKDERFKNWIQAKRCCCFFLDDPNL